MYTLEEILTAIDALRQRLPVLLGAEQWPAFERQLESYLDDLRAERQDPTMVRLRLLRLFMSAAAAQAALLSILDPARLAAEGILRSYDPTKGAPATESPPSPISNLQSPNLQSLLVTRYTDIACPRRVWLEGRMVVMVKLTLAPSSLSRVTEALQVLPSRPVDVTLTAPAFEIAGAATQSMAVMPDADSPAVYFELRPQQVGMTTLFFDFRQAGQPLGRTRVEVEVTVEPVADVLVSHAGPRVHFDPVLAEPPAVQLDVHYDASSGGHALIFTLFDRQGRALTLPQRRPLRVDPQRYAAQLYASLSTLAEAAAPTNAAAFEAEVRALGWRLWAELLPAAIKAAYAAHRSAWAGRTLLVVSDEPWIPWELVLPYDDPAGAWRDEAPWAVSLSLQRWLGGDATTAAIPGPPVRLALASLACIAPHRRDLRFAATERRHLQTLAARLSLRDLSPADARLATVLALLREGGYDWLHFAAHGELDEDATAAAIALEDGNLLPDLLYGPEIRPQIARTRPGVMLNICHGARSLWSLTHLGGWAQWFLSAGAGLFVAPLWTVTDHHAAAFAQTFYDRLTAPPVDPATPRATVAEAVSAARQATQGDGDPTWLAYSIYAHPHARLAPVTI